MNLRWKGKRSKLRVLLTFDVEQDCPPYLNSWAGVEQGMPKILELLDDKGVKATFFVTAETSKKFPSVVRRIVDEGHELASHGYMHERYDNLSKHHAATLLRKSLNVLRKHYDVISFRAPNLKLPKHMYELLFKNNILIDSSRRAYLSSFFREHRPYMVNGVLEVPVSATSSLLRLPWRLQEKIHNLILNGTTVYFAHPWEFVNMRTAPIRLDCKFNTGSKALTLLSKLIDNLKRLGADMLLMSDLI